MKYKSLIIALIGISNLQGMNPNSNYIDLQPTAPVYSVEETIQKHYPAFYAFTSQSHELNQRLKKATSQENAFYAFISTAEEIIKEKNKKPKKVSVVQTSAGRNCSQTISNCHFGGNVTQINSSHDATITNASKITINNSHTQKTLSYFKSSYTTPLGGLLCAGFLWWYLK